jgi:hypothetical protein
MAVSKRQESNPNPPADAPKLPEIDQESMTDSVADRERPDVAAEAEAAPRNVVLYKGLVSERRISREDFAQAGVPDQDGAVWTKGTGNVVPIDRFSEEALRVLAHTGEFQVIRDE